MEKFTKLSRTEMKNVLGGQDELTVDPGMTGGGCKDECGLEEVLRPCGSNKTCMYVGCGGSEMYWMCA